MRKRNKRKLYGRIKATLIILFIMFFSMTGVVFASGGDSNFHQKGFVYPSDGRDAHWINHESQTYKDIYGENAEIGNEPHSFLDEMVGFEDLLSVLLGQLVGAIATFIHAIFDGSGIDLSIDGIVYGRLNDTGGDGIRMNLMHFGLERNNVWGIFGASLYFILRDRFALIIIPIIGIVMVGKEAFKGGERGRAGIKEVFSKLVLFFVGIYSVPLLMEAYIYIRDVVMVITSDGLGSILGYIDGSVQTSGGIYDTLEAAYKAQDCALPLALILLAYAFAGLVYFWDYIRIAMLLSVTFGLFPLILIWWFFKRKIVTDWLNLIIPALLTPFIDMVLLLLPSFVASIFKKSFTVSGYLMDANNSFNGGILLVMVMLACIWTARAVRERILKLFGFEGLRSGGAGGLGLALAMLARGGLNKMAGGGGNGGDVSGGKESIKESNQGAERMHEAGEIMKEADDAIQEINSSDYDLLGGSEGESRADRLLREGGEEMEAAGIGNDEYAESESGASMEDIRTDEEPDMMAEEMSNPEIDGEAFISGDSEVIARDIEPGESNAEERNVGDVEMPNPDVADIPIDGSDLDNKVAATTRELPMRALTEDQNKFVESMSDRDKKRFENLRRIDALQEGISNNQKIIAESGYSRSAYDSAVAKDSELNRRLETLNAERKDIEERKSAIVNGNYVAGDSKNLMESIEAESRANERSINEIKNAQRENANYIKSMENSHRADLQNTGFAREIEARKGVESQYAHNSGLGGMSTRTYSNANDFLHQKRVDEVNKKHANYMNFDSKQYEGILTPAEKEAKYQERAERKAKQQKIDRVARVASMGAGVVAASAAAFSGPGTMATVGVLAGGTVENKVKEAAPMVEEAAVAIEKKSIATVSKDSRLRDSGKNSGATINRTRTAQGNINIMENTTEKPSGKKPKNVQDKYTEVRNNAHADRKRNDDDKKG